MAKEIQTSRIRLSELDEAIYHPKDDMPDVEDTSKNVLVFTLMGSQDGIVNLSGEPDRDGFPVLGDAETESGEPVLAEDQDEAYAHMIMEGRAVRYYAKRGGNGKLYNPMGLYTEFEQRHSKITRAGRELFKWSEVDRNTFMHYLNFLKTRNQAWLTTAQRELV